MCYYAKRKFSLTNYGVPPCLPLSKTNVLKGFNDRSLTYTIDFQLGFIYYILNHAQKQSCIVSVYHYTLAWLFAVSYSLKLDASNPTAFYKLIHCPTVVWMIFSVINLRPFCHSIESFLDQLKLSVGFWNITTSAV